MQSKQNSKLIEIMDEKHNIFLEQLKKEYNREFELINERLDGKKEIIERYKKDCEKTKGEVYNKLKDIELQMKDFMDKQTAHATFVTKEELKIKLEHIDEKLDTIINMFSRNGLCTAVKKPKGE
jgi:hypothetical protein